MALLLKPGAPSTVSKAYPRKRPHQVDSSTVAGLGFSSISMDIVPPQRNRCLQPVGSRRLFNHKAAVQPAFLAYDRLQADSGRNRVGC